MKGALFEGCLSSFYTIGNCSKSTSPFALFRCRETTIGEQLGAATCRFLYYWINREKINSKNYCENHKFGVYYRKRAEK